MAEAPRRLDLGRKASRGRDGGPPAAARRFRRPGSGAQESRRLHPIRQIARRGARSRAVRRAAWTWQDDARADRRARARRQFPFDLGSGHRQGGRSRGAAHQSRAARCAVHRRDSPSQSRDRGDSLSGDGGFPARPHHRRRACGALGEDRPRPVHADRRDDARRAPHHAVARSFRHSDPAQFLHDRRVAGHRRARRQSDRPRARR